MSPNVVLSTWRSREEYLYADLGLALAAGPIAAAATFCSRTGSLLLDSLAWRGTAWSALAVV